MEMENENGNGQAVGQAVAPAPGHGWALRAWDALAPLNTLDCNYRGAPDRRAVRAIRVVVGTDGVGAEWLAGVARRDIELARTWGEVCVVLAAVHAQAGVWGVQVRVFGWRRWPMAGAGAGAGAAAWAGDAAGWEWYTMNTAGDCAGVLRRGLSADFFGPGVTHEPPPYLWACGLDAWPIPGCMEPGPEAKLDRAGGDWANGSGYAQAGVEMMRRARAQMQSEVKTKTTTAK